MRFQFNAKERKQSEYHENGARIGNSHEHGLKEILHGIRRMGILPFHLQVAVVLGVCGGTSALSAANADVCIMAEGAELFFTAPFTSWVIVWQNNAIYQTMYNAYTKRNISHAAH